MTKPDSPMEGPKKSGWIGNNVLIASVSLGTILLHVLLRYGLKTEPFTYNLPLFFCFSFGGMPLVHGLLRNLLHREFGSDLLAGISIVTSVLLGEYLAGAIVVLMLSGGEALERYALNNASSVLRALAQRMPSTAHRKSGPGFVDIPIDQIGVGDLLVLFPHDICPVDGIVTDGHGSMDESFLTGEPFQITKAPGAQVISGAINGESAVTIRATKLPVDSRYAKIMEVMRSSQQNRPRIRRMADMLGAFYTPLALVVALAAWIFSGEAQRFLAVLVVATPCPLLIGIPVAIIGSISRCARRGIIVKDPAILEQVDQCRTVIFDKTGTLTYGTPQLTLQSVAPGFEARNVLALAASLEVYSRHPLASAILKAACKDSLVLKNATEISEPPGQGLRGTVLDETIEITSRNKVLKREPVPGLDQLPPSASGLECIVLIGNRYAATYTFHDAPRPEGLSFIRHLGPKHQFTKTMIVSGDRESEVRYLAAQVGIREIHAQKSPEEKVTIVRAETDKAKTLYVGDGINDAPAMMSATVGIAVGQNSDVTAEAAGAVIMDSELRKIDEFMHISRRMRRIALQSALGGMVLSIVGMGFAASGLLAPVAGALLQEAIDVLSIANALRAALPPKQISDF